MLDPKGRIVTWNDGALYVRQSILNAMPPWHGGGEMIVRVQFSSSTFKEGPARFEAGTPDISGAIVLGTAIDYLESLGRASLRITDKPPPAPPAVALDIQRIQAKSKPPEAP